MKYFCTFICLIASVNVQQIVADDQCIQKSPCRCKFGNGTGYDLSMLAKTLDGLDQNYIITPSIGTIKFFFHPCTDITNPIDSGNYSVSGTDNTVTVCTKKSQPTLIRYYLLWVIFSSRLLTKIRLYTVRQTFPILTSY